MAETVLETHGLTMRFGGVTASDSSSLNRAASSPHWAMIWSTSTPRKFSV